MNKKKIEGNHFKIFRTMAADFPIGEVWHEDRPDFWVHTDRGLLGIEHCLVHIPTRARTPLQAIESQTDEIVSMAQEHAELNGVPPIHATFLFGNNFNCINKAQRIDLGRAIARAIQIKLMGIGPAAPLTRIRIVYPDLPNQLHSVNLLTLKEGSNHSWRCARAGWVLEECVELFQNTIDGKTKVFHQYQGNCSECWLLMVSGGKPSGFIHPNENSISHKYSSPFNRTYYLDLGERKLHLLTTDCPAG